jgi:hypothetical protein
MGGIRSNITQVHNVIAYNKAPRARRNPHVVHFNEVV